MSAPLVEAHTTASINSGTVESVTIDVPAGTEAGDVLFVFIKSRESGSPAPDWWADTAPAGWTLAAAGQFSGSLSGAAFIRVAGGSEPGSYTWTFDPTAARVVAGMVRVSGANASDPIDAIDNISNTSNDETGELTAPSVDTTGPNRLVLRWWGQNHGNGSITEPASTTNVWSLTQGTSSGQGSQNLSWEEQAEAGATGTSVATTFGNDDRHLSFTVAIAPAGEPGGAEVNVPVADTTVEALAPGVAAGAAVNVPTADTVAEALAPSVQAGVNVTPPSADTTVEALAPQVSAGASVSVPSADTTVEALAPSIETILETRVDVPVADTWVDALAPGVLAGAVVQVPSADTVVEALAPGVVASIIIPVRGPVRGTVTVAPTVEGTVTVEPRE